MHEAVEFVVLVRQTARQRQGERLERFETWEDAVGWLESKGFEKECEPDPRYGSYLDTSFWNPTTKEEAKVSTRQKPRPQGARRDFDALPCLSDVEKLSPFYFATIYTIRGRFNGVVEFRTLEEMRSWLESEGFRPDSPRVDPRYASRIPEDYFNPRTREYTEVLCCEGQRR